MAYNYPKARKDNKCIDDFHGTKVCDHYTWMEDPDSEETKGFVEEQNKITMPYLQNCPARNPFCERMTELYNYPKYSCPKKQGSNYFFFLNTGLQNQSVMYKQDTLESTPTTFLDPNTLSEDGTVSLRGYSFSENGKFFAYGLSSSGSDWVTIKFKNVENNQDLPDVLERVKFSCMSWTHDHKGLFYNCYLEQEGKTDGTETTSNVNQKLFYHRLGTKQSEDVLFAEFPENPNWMSGITITDDGDYALLAISEGCDPVNKLWYIDLRTLPDGISQKPDWVKLVDNFDAEYDYITNEGVVFTFKTNLDAPRYKLINIDISIPHKDNWKELLGENEKDVLEWATCVNGDTLIVSYLRDVKNVLEVRHLGNGSLIKNLPLDVGTVVGFSGKKKHSEIFFMFMSFLTPGIIYRYDFESGDKKPSIFRKIEVKGFDGSLFETEQVFYSSNDGTKIPMFITHKKGIELDGSHPTLLYGYGGFNISITPSYSVSRVIFMQNLGGIVAIANIRGGGEYGETWHKSGSLKNKQNCFDDFQSAAKYLTDQKYTSPQKIAINGGSNGGLLVAACINQKPQLFGCAVAQVGVMDMLKFHKYTIGHAWKTDFGCADEDKEQFECLFKYSPIHNVQVPRGANVQYPSLLLMTGDHDDRVVPHHSLKYIAQVQDIIGARKEQKNPLLIRVDTKSGHGAGKPTAKVIEEVADMYGFIAKNLEADWSS
uniref:Prolyl endopeptidase n=1 Tax=Phallusia mammillata TaxID=59560 RepID=A0A6F9DQ84_9ASCI|nr:prolyl endopeptidase [Phallusia mammillata]